MKRALVSLVLAVSFLVVTNVKADYIPTTFVFGIDRTQLFNGQEGLVWGGPIELGEMSITVTQREDGSGVSFTLSAYNSTANLNGSKNFAVFYTQEAFSTVFSTAGLTANFNEMNGNANGWWANDGYLLCITPNNPDFPVTFDLDYADNQTGWADFYNILDDFKIGFHFGGEPNSAGVMFSYYVSGGGGSGEVPEPATLALLGLGLAGLGVARARRRK